MILRESVVVPTDYTVTVPVRMPFSRPHMPDWLSGDKKIRHRLLVAQTLLLHSSKFAAVAMLSVSGKDQTLRREMATRCLTDSIRPIGSTDQLAVE